MPAQREVCSIAACDAPHVPGHLCSPMDRWMCGCPAAGSVHTPPLPPQPDRLVLAATIYGHVREPGASTPAAHALLSVTVALPGCAPAGEKVQVYADERGDYEVTIEAGRGPDLTTCVLVEATLGGATATRNIEGVRFRTTSAAVQAERFRADVNLDPIAPLTRTDGEALLQSFVAMLNGDNRLDASMGAYVTGGPEALRAAVEDYRSLLGERISAVVTTSELSSSHQRVDATLRGDTGGPISLLIYQDRVRSFHSPLIDYSLRSRLFAAGFSRLVGSGDAESLARLLTADDIDYPIDDARRVIARYKPPFEVRGGGFELTGLDERQHALTYRLTWQGETEATSSTIRISYGDGLLSLRE